MGSATGVDLIKKESTIFSSNKNKSSQQPLGLHQPQNNKLKIRSKNCLESLFHSASDEDKETTWQQKRVSIKTLEGEFSVTMWASGADDGKKFWFLLNRNEIICLQRYVTTVDILFSVYAEVCMFTIL